MPKFIYTAKSGPGQTLQSEIEADSEQSAINILLSLGYFPISVQQQNVYLNKQKTYIRKVSRKDITLFTRQLSSLIESGVNILNSLQIVTDQTTNKYLKAILSDVAAKVKDGKPLSESLAAHEQVFSNLYTSIIHSGEASGNLEKVVKGLADYYEKDEEFRSSLKASLIYPLFISIIGVLTVAVLMGFVIPKLVDMFEDLGQSLPLTTRILISISGFIQNYWWAIFALVFFTVFSVSRMIKTPYGKIAFDKFQLKLPVIGEIVLKSEISRLTRTLSLLISSGLSIVSSLNVGISIVRNQVIKNDLEMFKEKITQGSSL
ncbi:MAG: type II secretion system F family protein, partial [Candidatus Omnitrophota bacterium]